MPLTPDDVEVFQERAEILRRYQDDGFLLLGLSWQPEVAEGTQTGEGVETVTQRMRDLLGIEMEVEYCPHAAGPPRCWCRKPLPGLGVLLVQRHQLDPARCIYVGAGAQDPPLRGASASSTARRKTSLVRYGPHPSIRTVAATPA